MVSEALDRSEGKRCLLKYDPAMEVKWLEDFIALAESQSFSRAAQARNITQSGFSRRIQSLEQWVGADLVDRSGWPPALTAAGRLFHEVARDLLQKLGGHARPHPRRG
jgi:DNA-binding transcriptional LysR family regulator